MQHWPVAFTTTKAFTRLLSSVSVLAYAMDFLRDPLFYISVLDLGYPSSTQVISLRLVLGTSVTDVVISWPPSIFDNPPHCPNWLLLEPSAPVSPLRCHLNSRHFTQTDLDYFLSSLIQQNRGKLCLIDMIYDGAVVASWSFDWFRGGMCRILRPCQFALCKYLPVLPAPVLFMVYCPICRASNSSSMLEPSSY